MRIIFYFLALFICLLPHRANARQVRMRMIPCATVYRTRDDAMKELVMYFDSLRIAPGEHIADIGARGAHLPGWLSLFSDNVDITLEDLDTGCLNRAQVSMVLNYYSGINGGKAANGVRTRIVIGNDSSTTLPSAAYQKVFLINTFHEITKQEAMAAELARVTASGGSLYVLEIVSQTRAVRRRDCPHLVTIESDMLKKFTAAGFRLVKKNIANKYKLRHVPVQVANFHFVKE